MKKNLSSVAFLTSVAFTLVACATPSTKLQNASGQVVDCSASGWGLVGTPIALASHSDCVDRMQASGYRPIDKGSIAPKLSADTGSLNLTLPEGWERLALNETLANNGTSFFAVNKSTDSAVIMGAVRREGVTDMMAYVMSRRANQENKLLNPQSTDITRFEIDKRQAFRFEVAGYVKGGLKVTYLYTVIEGAEQIVTVNTWTKSINFPYQKELLESLASKVTGQV